MDIGRQTYISVRRAIRQRAPRVKATKTWLRIHNEFALGARVGDMLYLTADDRQRLRDTLLRSTGLDPLIDALDGDRLAMALRGNDEKLARGRVFADEIHLFRLQRPIPLLDGPATTPAGSYLTTSPARLDTASIDTLVVIENGAAFLHWSTLQADAGIRQALALYRGHDDSAGSVLQLLQRVRDQIRILAAVDLDPAGLRIALSLGADAILVPEHPARLLDEPALNKPSAFDKQNPRRQAENVPSGWQDLWDWIHQNRIAVTQEALLARGWRMVALPAEDGQDRPSRNQSGDQPQKSGIRQ